MAFTCDSCHKRQLGNPHRSMTGRNLCGPCDERLLAAAAGVIDAQREGRNPIVGALSTATWLQAVRRTRGRRG